MPCSGSVLYVCTSAEGVLKERPGPSFVPFLSEGGSPAFIKALRALMRDALSVGTVSTSPVIFSCGPWQVRNQVVVVQQVRIADS